MRFPTTGSTCLLALLVLFTPSCAFTTQQSSISRKAKTTLTRSSFIPSPKQYSTKTSSTQRHVDLVDSSASEPVEFNPNGMVPLKKETMLTPEGYGFTAAAKRILKEANRAGNGYYKAYSTDNIMTVIAAITEGGEYDAALVFDEDTKEMMGLFTESDYIRVRKKKEKN
jgi:hypothetical protein